MNHSSIRSITMVRHGMTEWAATGRHTSVTDLDLNDNGRNQAEALRRYFEAGKYRFDSVYTSPLLRARHTAMIAGFDPRVEPDLHEWYYGRYEGKTTAEIHQENPNWSIFRCGAPEGESRHDIRRRCRRLLKGWSSAGCEQILCFAHGHILRSLACIWLDMNLRFGDQLRLDAASISRLGWEHNSPAIEFWNQCWSQL